MSELWLGVHVGVHLLRPAGHGERVLAVIARVMEYQGAREVYRDDIEMAESEGAATWPEALA